MFTPAVANVRECMALTIVMQQREPITFVSTFAERLKSARERRNLSQAALARAAGVSAGAIGNYEAGTRAQPRDLFELAQALGVDAEWLATGEAAQTSAESIVFSTLRAGGVNVRPLRSRRDLEGLLQEFGHHVDPEDVGYVPDFVAISPDDHLVFVEVKATLYPGALEDVQRQTAGLPGELVVIPSDGLGDGMLQVIRALGLEPHTLLVAHDLSQARNTESLPRVKWEELMTADLSRPFELEVIDDALAPEIFRGCVALLAPDREPEPAWPVLVRTRDGSHFLRDYEAGTSGRWRAVARARGYAPLDSEIDGLVIVAAMEGYKRPRAARR